MLKRLGKSIKQFFEKLITTVKNFFTSKVDDKTKELDKLPKNGKIEIDASNAKQIKECDNTLKELEHAKTPEDVDKIMTKHKKNKAKIAAVVATATITVGAALTYLKHEKNKHIQELHKEYNALIEKEAKEFTKIIDTIDKKKSPKERGDIICDYLKKIKPAHDAAEEAIKKQAREYGYTDVIKAKMEVISDKTNATMRNAGNMLDRLVHSDKYEWYNH